MFLLIVSSSRNRTQLKQTFITEGLKESLHPDPDRPEWDGHIKFQSKTFDAYLIQHRPQRRKIQLMGIAKFLLDKNNSLYIIVLDKGFDHLEPEPGWPVLGRAGSPIDIPLCYGQQTIFLMHNLTPEISAPCTVII